MEKVADAMADLRDIRSFPARGNDAATRGHDVSGVVELKKSFIDKKKGFIQTAKELGLESWLDEVGD